ncbi:MAG: beta-glucosidase [Gaiellaceae bacterium]|nr:beta-glucosidase [Gaiellaceae bacterium]
MKRFPEGFTWGVSTSAYQVEGAVDEDGRVPSIWDTFTHLPGTIDGGGTGDLACDNYHRWREDLDLIAGLGASAYRFSIAWPRMHDARGVQHYDRLIDGLLERGIEPLVTLYHWDLPQALEDEGGWLNRDTVERFAEYAARCFDAYGDRVNRWITINEPWIVGLLGYRLGLHAPGHQNAREEVTAFHHLLLAHGRAMQELRASPQDGLAGITNSLMPHYPYSDDPADVAATRGSDGYVNRFFLDSVFKGVYPEDTLELFERVAGPLDFIRDGDLEVISTPSDFLGVNYYSRRVMRAVPDGVPHPWEVVSVGSAPTTDGGTAGVPMTEAGTEITPESFTDLLVRLQRDYDVPILITENGAVFGDEPGPGGRVHDERRVRYIQSHLEAVHSAIEQGADVQGYCYWSLLDNFEWALGYAQRFGIVHVDYETLTRTVKDSGHYYARIARANALVDPEDAS